MNYRHRQVKLMWERDISAKKSAWLAKEQTYKQDIINLQNSTDAKVIEDLNKSLEALNKDLEQLEKDLTKQKDLLNQTIELLGKDEVKSLSDLENLLEGKTLAELKTELKENLSLKAAKITALETNLLQLAKTKLTNQKQAKALVEQLEKDWAQKQ